MNKEEIKTTISKAIDLRIEIKLQLQIEEDPDEINSLLDRMTKLDKLIEELQKKLKREGY